MASASKPHFNQRLDSWKEIAAFFGCDERTVRRWEKERGLPVHRLPGSARGKVFAYVEELTQWLKTPEMQKEAAGATPAPDMLPLAVPPNKTSLPPTVFGDRRWLLVPPLLALLFAVWFFRPGYRSANAGQLKEQVSPVVSEMRRPASHEAEELYLKGRYYWNRRRPDSLNKAVDYFTQAIVRDPAFAPAYVGLADCYNLLREYTVMPASEAYPRALAAAKKAVDLDDQSSEAHASLAFVSFYGMWDLPTADHEFRRAIELNPNNGVAHLWYANYLSSVGRTAEAMAEMEHARSLDPTSPAVLADQGALLFGAGRAAQGIALLQQLEVSEPDFLSPHRYLAAIYLGSGNGPGYLAEAKKEAMLLHDKSGLATNAAAEKGFAEGGTAGMLTSLVIEQKKLYTKGLISPVVLASTYAALGNRDEALRYLNIGYDQHDERMVSLRSIRAFNVLRQDPAYRELLTRIGLPLEN